LRIVHVSEPYNTTDCTREVLVLVPVAVNLAPAQLQGAVTWLV